MLKSIFTNITAKFVNFSLMIFISFVLISIGAALSTSSSRLQFDVARYVSEPSILKLELEGVIIDGKEFLAELRKYRDSKNIKGILIHIDSPGGVVGPSQEIYSEILKVREELQKPVVVVSGAVVASGAYYVAVAADKVITSSGTILGSIGVIMEFANLEKLYNWAKIKRYSIKAGRLKDAGADYREMTSEERNYLQGVADEILAQFKEAVGKNRKMDQSLLDQYADGRIFTGSMAVKLGFADQVGDQSDALKIVGELAGLGAKPKVFTPPKKPRSIDLLDILFNSYSSSSSPTTEMTQSLKALKLLGKPLYLMPGGLGF